MEIIRLDKFISSQIPSLSRKDVKDLVKKGRVTLDGKAVKAADVKLDANSARVTVDGKEVEYKKHLYIMLNKPSGVVCATRDGISATVLELLSPDLRRDGLFPAGRLDKDTEGFVLITSDGELAHRMLAPKSHVDKEYFVRLEKPLQEDACDIISSGMTLSDGTECMPAQLKIISSDECMITLHQGMFHQVKRMFEALDNRVIYLKRVRIGGVMLDRSLKTGESRELTSEEVSGLIDR